MDCGHLDIKNITSNFAQLFQLIILNKTQRISDLNQTCFGLP